MMMWVMLCYKSSGGCVTKDCWRTPSDFRTREGCCAGLFVFGVCLGSLDADGFLRVLVYRMVFMLQVTPLIVTVTRCYCCCCCCYCCCYCCSSLPPTIDHRAVLRCLLSSRLDREGGCWHRVRTTMDLLRGMLILRGVGFVRRGSIAGLVRVAHLQRVDDGRRMGRIVRIGRADVLLLRER